jgi:hypothetical protein
MEDFVGFGIDGTVQPVVVPIDADRFLVDRELIRTYGTFEEKASCVSAGMNPTTPR